VRQNCEGGERTEALLPPQHKTEGGGGFSEDFMVSLGRGLPDKTEKRRMGF